MSPIPNCRICSQPLDPEDLNTGKQWHAECEVCQICGASMNHATKVIDKCLSDGGPVAHLGCYHAARIRELKDKVIPIQKGHIEALNIEILMFKHIVNPDETDYQSLYELLKTTKELAASISFVLELTKDKIRIDSSQEYAEKVKVERKQKAAAEAISDAEKNRIAAEKADPQLKLKRKAIEGAMKMLGLSLEAATAMVESQMSKTQ